MKHRYIVVEGSIGSGKSALSRRLAQYFNSELLIETPEKNPFLMPFYLNAAQHGLAMQLHFLMQRSDSCRQIAQWERQAPDSRLVSDFLLEKDQIFAPIILDDDEATLYWQIRHRVLSEYPAPDLVIYLQGSDEVINKRLQKKEKMALNIFPDGYLQQIHDEYRRFFHLYQHAPLLIANTDELDFSGNDDHFELLLRAMANMKGSRHYLNLSE